LPHEHIWVCDGLIDGYRRLAQAHVNVLKDFGIPARACPPRGLQHANDSCGHPAVDWACFGSLSAWEVVSADGRKLTGLAQQRRKSGVLLVAGTLIGSTDWALLCDAMGHPEDEATLRQRTVSGAEIAGRQIESELFASALLRTLKRALSASGEAADPSGSASRANSVAQRSCRPTVGTRWARAHAWA
jgi:lipoate-protein ligase A